MIFDKLEMLLVEELIERISNTVEKKKVKSLCNKILKNVVLNPKMIYEIFLHLQRGCISMVFMMK